MQYRSIPGIVRFTLGLLGASPSKTTSHLVQTVTLPPHHLDKPGDEPKCKAFAFVTLYQVADVEALLNAWPWDRSLIEKSATKDDTPASTEVREATKFGLRILSKKRWDRLKEEYLAYRATLLEELAESEAAQPDPPPRQLQRDPDPPGLAKVDTSGYAEEVIDSSSPYPPNCLVFVRNVHSGTNKTTLRSLFSQAFQNQSNVSDDGLDYVDFNKGMTSVCLPFPAGCTVHLTSFVRSAIFVWPRPFIAGFWWNILPPSSLSNLTVLTGVELTLPRMEEQYSSWKWCWGKGRRYTGRRCPRKYGTKPCKRPSTE